MKVIGVTGMPGSGKSVVARMAKGLGVEIIRIGDIIRDEAKKRGADVGDVAVKIRSEHGKFVVAERCIEKIKKLEKMNENSNLSQKSQKKHQIFMIEGIRSPYEVQLFKKNFRGFRVIAIHSSPQARFRRLKHRKRFDDSNKIYEFKKRDNRELGFGIGGVIATSDYMIVNEGPIWKFKSDVRRILKNEM